MKDWSLYKYYKRDLFKESKGISVQMGQEGFVQKGARFSTQRVQERYIKRCQGGICIKV